MIPVSLTPWRLGMAGLTYAVLATALGLVYLGYTIRFARILRGIPEDREPHAGARSAQGQRPLPAPAVHRAHALRHA